MGTEFHPKARLLDPSWVEEALKDLIDDHGRHPEETAMSEKRYLEIKGVVYDDDTMLVSAPPSGSPDTLSVSDIIMRCNAACRTMGRTNPHRFLLFTCASALRQLVDRLEKFEGMVH